VADRCHPNNSSLVREYAAHVVSSRSRVSGEGKAAGAFDPGICDEDDSEVVEMEGKIKSAALPTTRYWSSKPGSGC
jgi:hypothetical protein